jgi:uncharacterized protein (TIGR02996 family)
VISSGVSRSPNAGIAFFSPTAGPPSTTARHNRSPGRPSQNEALANEPAPIITPGNVARPRRPWHVAQCSTYSGSSASIGGSALAATDHTNTTSMAPPCTRSRRRLAPRVGLPEVVVEDELLAAVVRAPDDDGPRLIYADWLEERGDPARAELIRVQCALAAGPPDDQRPRLERRARLARRSSSVVSKRGTIGDR